MYNSPPTQRPSTTTSSNSTKAVVANSITLSSFSLSFPLFLSSRLLFSSRRRRRRRHSRTNPSLTQTSRGMGQAAAGLQGAFGAMGQQVQQAATNAAAQAAAKEVQNQMSNALGSAFGGGRRK